MELVSKILTVGIFATSAMTFTSYLFSYLLKGNFKEPKLLNSLLDHLPSLYARFSKNNVVGWVIHFSIGCFFVLVFEILRSLFSIELSFKTAIIFGIVAGTIAIIVWSLMLNLHPHPPAIKRKMFYFQLIFAHLVFGIIMIECLQLFDF